VLAFRDAESRAEGELLVEAAVHREYADDAVAAVQPFDQVGVHAMKAVADEVAHREIWDESVQGADQRA